MASADFSQLVVTTANDTACETSTHKVHALSPHPPATFTGTSGNFWTSSLLADLSVFPSLICGSCSSGQGFAYSFFQIPPRGGHPCCSAMCFVVAYAHSGLSPVRARPWRAYQKRSGTPMSRPFLSLLSLCLMRIFIFCHTSHALSCTLYAGHFFFATSRNRWIRPSTYPRSSTCRWASISPSRQASTENPGNSHSMIWANHTSAPTS